ncbi:MAG: Single-stranded DNA-binding protein [Turneriella sp.]|nr:Single-stranded DNA-binding protein [Turneriella sp.]
MNKVCLSGRLTTDPYFKKFENDVKRCTIFVANDVYYGSEKSTGFYKVTAWGKKAELIAQHFKTGVEIFVTGHLEQNRYEDENGKLVYDNEIVVDEFNFSGNRQAIGAGEAIRM